MNMFTQEEMAEIVGQAKFQATQQLEKQITDAIDYGVKAGVMQSIRDNIQKQINEQVATISEEEWSKVVPQIREIVSNSFIVIAELLAKAMTEQAIKSLDGYNRKDIIKKLFDVY